MPALTQETPKSKTPEAEPRSSERLKRAEPDANALTPHLQVTERQAAEATNAAEKCC